jgi:hypothetical protein
MEIDEAVFHEPRQELGHELTEDVTLVAPEVVEAVIGDRGAAAQPPVGGVELDEPRDLATRADAITGGIDSGGSWGRWLVSRQFRRERGRRVETAQIELVHDGGDRTHLVIGGHLGVEVAPGDLAALRALDPHAVLRLHRATRPDRPGGFIGVSGPQWRLGR